MEKPKLRQLLEFIEDSPGGISLQGIARALDLSLSQTENMLEYWIRKGRLRQVRLASDCASCASGGSCPFLTDFPGIFQVIEEGAALEPEGTPPPCR